MKAYSLKTYLWTIKQSTFGNFEFGWIQINRNKQLLFSSIKQLNKYIFETYNIKNFKKFTAFKNNNEVQEIDYVTDYDRYKLRVCLEEIK